MPLPTLRAAAVALTIALAASPAMAADPADPVVATINGQEVKRSDVVALQQTIPQLRQVPTEMVFDQLLEHLISTQLIVTEARRQNLQQSEEVKARLRELENQVLQQVFLRQAVEPKLTDEALKARYEEQVKEAAPVEEVHARHILLPSEEEAKKAIEALNKGKAFEEVAKEMSKGPSAPMGGDLGYFTKDQMVPEFAEAAFALKKGEITKQPVKTQFGWHVIKLEDRRTAQAPAFDEVKDTLREQLAEEIATKLVEDLRAKADVKIVKPDTASAPAPEKK